MRLGKVSIAVKTFGVCDFFLLAVTDWRVRRWRLWFLALMTATLIVQLSQSSEKSSYLCKKNSSFFLHGMII